MKIITKKYKTILLGDNLSGKTYLINKLKNKKIEDLNYNYYPNNNVNFYKHHSKKVIDNNINFQKELHHNVLYFYDVHGNKNKLDLAKKYVYESQICLIIINPNNYLSHNKNFNQNIINFNINNIIDSLDFWINFYLNNFDKENRYLILVCLNIFHTKNNRHTYTDINNSCDNYNKNNANNANNTNKISNDINEKLQQTEIKIKDYISEKFKYYKHIYYMDFYNVKYDDQKIIERIFSEIHNNNILNIMTRSNIEIKTNLKNSKLYFKKEINYLEQNNNQNSSETTSLLNNSSKLINNENCFIM